MRIPKTLTTLAFGLFTLGIVVTALAETAPADPAFQSRWQDSPDRMWIGPAYWANRLQDWKIDAHRVVCDSKGPRLGLHTLHLLTHRLTADNRPVVMSVVTGTMRGDTEIGRVGFLIGVGEGKMDYRSAALVQMAAGPGGGIFACVDSHGRLQIRDNTKAGRPVLAASDGQLPLGADVALSLTLTPDGDQSTLSLVGRDVTSDKQVVVTATVPSSRLTGNTALAREVGGKKPVPRWFSNWTIRGQRVLARPTDTFGPIACTQYTLSRNILKLTVQMLPIGASEDQEVCLQVKTGADWKTVATTRILTPSYTAPFRIANWDDSVDVPYRVTSGDAIWEGTIRKDPKKKRQLVVAGFTGNHNNAHGFGKPGYDYIDRIYFPHADMMEKVAIHQPDVLFFSGDQVYEGDSPTYADRAHLIDDYLYKWLLWCWAYRDYTKDMPCICLPDDHDVYQGNLWGQGGRKAPKGQGSGGYVHDANFVKVVERTQTSHLPDPFDPTPVKQGIGVYYTSMVYGGVGFAIIEDRKFKSGMEDLQHPGKMLKGTDRPDLWKNPALAEELFDQEGKVLLGQRQLKFLDAFAKDWRGQKMKICLSQTIFASLATHHGGMWWMSCDLDSNGWPQTGRRKAVDALRRGFTFHLAGDQHLASLVHHGIVEHDDANWSMCVPSICNFYPRAWAPELGPDDKYTFPTREAFAGRRHDSFGHPVTVWAVANPGKKMGHQRAQLHDKMPGYGIVKIDKESRQYIVQCWPRYAVPGKDAQYPGWPVTISQQSNYGRAAKAWLPTLVVKGITDPVVQVINESNGEVIYTLRIQGTKFQPKTFQSGTYTVRIGDPDSGIMKTLKGLRAEVENDTLQTVAF